VIEMHLYDIPMILVLIGLALYAVLGGADFGAGLWQLTTLVSGRSGRAHEDNEHIREHAHHSMGPVWEANHVWLIFVLTVTWTAYPTAFGSIASTLAVPLFITGIGVIFRGAAYALRAGSSKPSELGLIDTIFSLSSILTPFALGTIVGAIASRRVPVGNAAGHLFSSWLNPTSIMVGLLAVATCAYMAAVYLAADAAREGEQRLTEQFRLRALLAGAVAGALAVVGLVVLHSDAHPLYHRLLDGPGLVGAVISILAGITTLTLVSTRRYGLARVSAALAVAGLIAGWALAQQPTLLAGLTIQQAAAPHETLVVVIAAIAMGAAILFPSLGLLFRLVLGGQLHRPATAAGDVSPGPLRVLSTSRQGLYARLALAGLLGGLGFLTAAEAPWAHAVGVISLFGCMIFAFLAVGPGQLAAEEDEEPLSPLRLPTMRLPRRRH
jgi:cytochrome bd ubiquinol oxidase subunit II